MSQSETQTVEEYLGELPEDRRDAIAEVRQAILDNLDDGIVEVMRWGMINYEIPLETFPDTYNGKPLQYAALASQKKHMALYLNSLYMDADDAQWFETKYRETGKKLDMGKSCVRFTKLDNLPVKLVGEAIARVGLGEFLEHYKRAKG